LSLCDFFGDALMESPSVALDNLVARADADADCADSAGVVRAESPAASSLAPSFVAVPEEEDRGRFDPAVASALDPVS